jgi:hypothetical protein
MYLRVYDIVQCPCSFGLTAAVTVRHHSTLQGTKNVCKIVWTDLRICGLQFRYAFPRALLRNTNHRRKYCTQLRFYNVNIINDRAVHVLRMC